MMMVKDDVGEETGEGSSEGSIGPICKNSQPEYISWTSMMSETEDSKDPIDKQQNAIEGDKNDKNDKGDKNDEGDKNVKNVKNDEGEGGKNKDTEWEDITPREVNNCSSDYYSSYVRERPVEQDEWLAVNEVTAPQPTSEWFKAKDKRSNGSATIASTIGAGCGGCIKGWVTGMQQCLGSRKRSPKPKPNISDEPYVEINTSGESDTDTGELLQERTPLLQKRPDTPLPRGARGRAQGSVSNVEGSRASRSARDMERPSCGVFCAPMMMF